jgi:Rod binding domain-containing protein
MSFGSVGPIDQSLLPDNIRNGTPEQKQAYTSALGFEQMLVDQLSQAMASSASGDGSSSDGGDGSDSSDTGSSSLLGGSDPASQTYAQLLPTALTSSVMSAGGLGVAQQLATAIDPAAFSHTSTGNKQ